MVQRALQGKAPAHGIADKCWIFQGFQDVVAELPGEVMERERRVRECNVAVSCKLHRNAAKTRTEARDHRRVVGRAAHKPVYEYERGRVVALPCRDLDGAQ